MINFTLKYPELFFMKDDRKTEIKVGLTVLVGILIFIWIFGWAKNFSLKSNEHVVKVKFDKCCWIRNW
jgi:hypothetical protein